MLYFSCFFFVFYISWQIFFVTTVADTSMDYCVASTNNHHILIKFLFFSYESPSTTGSNVYHSTLIFPGTKIASHQHVACLTLTRSFLTLSVEPWSRHIRKTLLLRSDVAPMHTKSLLLLITHGPFKETKENTNKKSKLNQ